MFDNNFGRCGPIFKIVSPFDLLFSLTLLHHGDYLVALYSVHSFYTLYVVHIFNNLSEIIAVIFCGRLHKTSH